MHRMIQNQRIAQAFLMIGPRHASALVFVNRLVALLMCQQEHAPCGQCQPCRLVMQKEHPDVLYIQPETVDKGPIKIEQIRMLQQDIYQTPQCGTRRFIIIEPADKLNRAAANALLKILEEPPEHTIFILIAEQISTLPATILSRCQHYVVPAPEQNETDHLATAAWYEEPDERAILYRERLVIIELLNDLISGKTTPCSIAASWSKYSLTHVLWFLYLLMAQTIDYQLDDQPIPESYRPLKTLAQSLPPETLFRQLDKINGLSRLLQQHITLNSTLALEDLLLGFITG
ncbi:MAG: DNA polymerase III subunit delta' C-terminal domain-containing protein [Legionellaceae bacterium]|nr:DNA polymerase III subunit delta' C-terminal domain-containing protein [Legionellaceae bacterium]